MNKKAVFFASYPDSLINFRLHLIQAFIQKGYEIVAVAPEDKEVAKKLQKINVKFIPIPLERNGLNPFADLFLIFKLYRILKQEKPDLIFSYTIKPVIYGSFVAKFVSVPEIYSMITGTGYVFLDQGLKNKIVGWIARKLFRFSLGLNKIVFFQNKDNQAFFIQQSLVSNKNKTVVVNGSGVDCEYYSEQGFPQTLSFLMIARFLKDKGIYEYVEAAKQIKARYPKVECFLVGWIDTNPNSILPQELNAWVNQGYIHHLGKLSDVRSAITQASVYVLPSYHEGTPRTVLEAMAMGRPIITTDTPGCRETVIPKINGFLVPPKDAQALASAMEYFILNSNEIPKMGKESRKIAVEKYDVHKVNTSLLKAMGIE